MGLLDRLGGEEGGGSRPDDTDDQQYRVVVRDTRTEQAASLPDELDDKEWHFDAENVPTKEQFRFEYGDMLDGGRTYICAPVQGRYVDFDRVEWSFEQEGRRPGDSDRPPWVDDLIAAQRDDDPMDGDLETMLIKEIAKHEGPGQALQEYKEVEAIKSGEGGTLLDSVDDPTNMMEVASRSFMSMAEGYDTMGEAVEDVFGGVMSAGLQGAVGPAAPSPGQQPGAGGHPDAQGGVREAETGPQTPESRGKQRGSRERASPLREEFESDLTESDDPTGPAVDPGTEAQPDAPTQADPDPDPDADTDDDDPDDDEQDDEVPVPTTVTEVKALDYGEKQKLAARNGHDTNGIGATGDELTEWLTDELLDTPDDTPDGDDADDAESDDIDAEIPDDHPMTAQPTDAAQDDDSTTDDAETDPAKAVTDGGET